LGVNQFFDYIEKEPKAWKELIEGIDNPDEMKGLRKRPEQDDLLERMIL